MTSIRAGFLTEPAPGEFVDWLAEGAGGAVEFVITRGKSPGLTADPNVEDAELRARARGVHENDGVHRVLLTHVTGTIEAGEPVAIVGASADHRDQAFEAVDALLENLGGVARRQDLPE